MKREEELKKIMEEKESFYKAQLENLQKEVGMDAVCWGPKVPPPTHLFSQLFSLQIWFFIYLFLNVLFIYLLTDWGSGIL